MQRETQAFPHGALYMPYLKLQSVPWSHFCTARSRAKGLTRLCTISAGSGTAAVFSSGCCCCWAVATSRATAAIVRCATSSFRGSRVATGIWLQGPQKSVPVPKLGCNANSSLFKCHATVNSLYIGNKILSWNVDTGPAISTLLQALLQCSTDLQFQMPILAYKSEIEEQGL